MNDLSGRFTLDARSNRSDRQGPSGDLVDFAISLAGPVARQMLTLREADASLLRFALEAERDGTIQCDALSYGRILAHILRQYARELADRRLMAEVAVEKTAWRLIKRLTPSRCVLAEAHNANSDYGFPLREEEVHGIVSALAHDFLNPKEGATP